MAPLDHWEETVNCCLQFTFHGWSVLLTDNPEQNMSIFTFNVVGGLRLGRNLYPQHSSAFNIVFFHLSLYNLKYDLDLRCKFVR